MKNFEEIFERNLFASRWLLVPFFVGLIAAVSVLLLKFIKEIAHIVLHINELSGSEVILHILTLIDIALIASLIFIIVFSGYESFVSKIEVEDDGDRPGWMGKVGFAGLKIKVIGSIVAISSIELLKVFLTMTEDSDQNLVMWRVIIHITFVISGTLMALQEKLTSSH
ncbi:TIGR00645 family protein [Microbulbifer agarilyticus]|uniref:TIGR00645 family protein n=1 Tax=Microbulbifer agarilyticus TaxID=260552 RepID=UPI001CD7D6B8|nr:TIGR00645 family protein [Microbulbifer agarilyticus]MCA0899190.1 TIGR00645 family protein [Microbulbifer agarilyticus]